MRAHELTGREVVMAPLRMAAALALYCLALFGFQIGRAEMPPVTHANRHLDSAFDSQRVVVIEWAGADRGLYNLEVGAGRHIGRQPVEDELHDLALSAGADKGQGQMFDARVEAKRQLVRTLADACQQKFSAITANDVSAGMATAQAEDFGFAEAFTAGSGSDKELELGLGFGDDDFEGLHDLYLSFRSTGSAGSGATLVMTPQTYHLLHGSQL